MDAISLLIGDHNRVRGLFARFKTAMDADDAATMGEVASKIFEELKVHTEIEEKIFYPKAKEQKEEAAELVAEGLQEHHVVDTLMAECQALKVGSEEWTAKLSVLIENVEHHAEEEEKELFPKVRRPLGAEVLERLADEMSATKKSMGAPTADEAMALTKEALMEKARAQEIPGRSTMDHEELALTVDPR